MWLNRAAHFLERVAHPLSRVINNVGIGLVMVMMLLTVMDVSLRYLFNRPIPGAFELTGFMMAILVFFALAYTAIQRGHITIDLVVSRLPQRIQAVIYSITYFLSLGLFSLVTWRNVLQAKTTWLRSDVSADLLIPIAPFAFLVALGLAVLSLVLLVNLLHSLAQAVRK